MKFNTLLLLFIKMNNNTVNNNTANTTAKNNINNNKLNKICNDYMFKKCDRTDCKFLHDDTVCFYYWKNGECRNGDNCTRSHDVEIRKNYINSKETKPKRNKDKYNKNKRVKNTECFEPMTKPVDMRLVYDLRSIKSNDISEIPQLTSRDVLLSPNLFDDFVKYEIYNKLVYEIKNCGIPEEQLLKLWHGNDKIKGTHLIANDKVNWKELCPTFNMVISRLKDVFKMDVKATRLNWYRDPDHWKAFHFDSARVNPNKALTQNFTVAVSFGITKDAAFEHATTKTVISIPQSDGTVYSFTNDTNGIWRHGILQDKQEEDLGRISIIAWGWIDNVKQIS